MASSSQRRTSRRKRRGKRAPMMVFARRNYVLLLIGVAAIVIGFAILRIDNQVESLISLYIAPLLILDGYLEIIYAILWRPKQEPPASST